tara:strand:+ start:13126 stop:13428 length:303 start_codon:yes stop_codon:yes gene_type:complete
MTHDDFDYTEYPSDTLLNAIKNAQKYQRECVSKYKSCTKKLRNPRGYSKQKLSYCQSYVRNFHLTLDGIKTEIQECQEELAKREPTAELLKMAVAANLEK